MLDGYQIMHERGGTWGDSGTGEAVITWLAALHSDFRLRACMAGAILLTEGFGAVTPRGLSVLDTMAVTSLSFSYQVNQWHAP